MASVATKSFKCARCETEIKEGSKYVRRPEYTGTHYKTARYHPECAEAHIQEVIKCKK